MRLEVVAEYHTKLAMSILFDPCWFYRTVLSYRSGVVLSYGGRDVQSVVAIS